MHKEGIKIRKCELEAILVDYRKEYKPEELANLREELFYINHIFDLWHEFGDVPMNPETECLDVAWHEFPAGTFREDIWHWFEACFGVSVGRNLMGS